VYAVALMCVVGCACFAKEKMNSAVQRLRHFQSSLKQTQRSFGWLRMNKRIDEFGGLRESTYREYALTPKEILYHIFGLFLPAYFIYSGLQWGFERRLRLMGIPKDYTQREFVEIEE
jgi:hypothetical protein